ncbi:MAG: hypothetical protein AAFO91_09310 [Bacteroidota bacterium]
MSQSDSAKATAVFVGTVLLCNFPLFDLSGQSSIMGIPTLLFYLLAVWVAVVLLVLRIYNRKRSSH